MIPHCFIFILLLLTFSQASYAEQPPRNNVTLKLNLAQAVALALHQNRTVENAYLQRIPQKLDLRIARESFAPKLTLGATVAQDARHLGSNERQDSQTYDTHAQVALRLPHGGQLALNAIYSAHVNQSTDQTITDSVSLDFTQPLLKGGGLTAGKAQLTLAERTEHAHILQLQDTLSGLITTVIKQYRTYISARRELEIRQVSVQRAREQLEITRELIGGGRLPSVELVQAETSLANQELTQRSVENDLDAARIQLLLLLRLSPQTHIIATESLQVSKLKPSLKDLHRIAFAQRTDYRLAQIAVKNAQLQVQLARNNQLWQLDAQIQYGINRNGEESWSDVSAPGEYQAQLNLSIPLDNLAAKRDWVAAKVALRQAHNQVQEIEELIVLQLENAYRDVQIRWEQLGLSERTVALSRKQLELEQEKLTVGRSSSFQVVSFQNSLMEAEHNHLNAQIDYLNALSELDELVGITLQRWGVQINEKDTPPHAICCDFME